MGHMGKVGYTTNDPRVSNIDHTGTIKKHSDWFIDKCRQAVVLIQITAFYNGEL
jgi:hypothetical protein